MRSAKSKRLSEISAKCEVRKTFAKELEVRSQEDSLEIGAKCEVKKTFGKELKVRSQIDSLEIGAKSKRLSANRCEVRSQKDFWQRA